MNSLFQNPDSTEYAFIDWNVSINFYTQALAWLNHSHGTAVAVDRRPRPPFSAVVRSWAWNKSKELR